MHGSWSCKQPATFPVVFLEGFASAFLAVFQDWFCSALVFHILCITSNTVNHRRVDILSLPLLVFLPLDLVGFTPGNARAHIVAAQQSKSPSDRVSYAPAQLPTLPIFVRSLWRGSMLLGLVQVALGLKHATCVAPPSIFVLLSGLILPVGWFPLILL